MGSQQADTRIDMIVVKWIPKNGEKMQTPHKKAQVKCRI